MEGKENETEAKFEGTVTEFFRIFEKLRSRTFRKPSEFKAV